MGNIVSTNLNVHWVKRVSARYAGSALMLTFEGADGRSEIGSNATEVLVFLDDDNLRDRLIAAINGAAVSPCS